MDVRLANKIVVSPVAVFPDNEFLNCTQPAKQLQGSTQTPKLRSKDQNVPAISFEIVRKFAY